MGEEEEEEIVVEAATISFAFSPGSVLLDFVVTRNIARVENLAISFRDDRREEWHYISVQYYTYSIILYCMLIVQIKVIKEKKVSLSVKELHSLVTHCKHVS